MNLRLTNAVRISWVLTLVLLTILHVLAFSQTSLTTLLKGNVIMTSDSMSYRMEEMGALSFLPARQPLETEVAIFVNPEITFQTFVGIGGAVTDASAEVFSTLSKEKQQEFINAYFDKESGIGYSLLRTTIHSCDFSRESYTYVTGTDKELRTFNIAHDRKHRIPLLKLILQKTGDIPLYASPWSPPPFMKSNGSMLQGGKLLPEYYETWADYFIRFIQSYESVGLPIWGVTVQNEPMATQKWESCIYTAEEERDFLKYHLGPAMHAAGYGDKKIIVWDHNRDLINHRANTIFGDPDAAKYAWGIGFHWYETWTGGDPMFVNLGKVQEAFPDKHLIFTEGCNERFDAAKYQFWPNAERYGRSMIHDFNHGTVAWTDWNILLDETGGPNHVMNLCFAPVHADTQTGELIFTPSYYYIGHFSKYIRPNAKRISAVASRSALLTTAFQNEDGSVAIVVMNTTDKPVTYQVHIAGEMTEVTIWSRAIQTIVL